MGCVNIVRIFLLCEPYVIPFQSLDPRYESKAPTKRIKDIKLVKVMQCTLY